MRTRTGRCAICQATGALRHERTLIDHRRVSRWICVSAYRRSDGSYEGCGRPALTAAELDAAILDLAASDPTLVRFGMGGQADESRAQRYAAGGRGRPPRFVSLDRYAIARRDAVVRLKRRLERNPEVREIAAELGLQRPNGTPSSTFFRYEAALRGKAA